GRCVCRDLGAAWRSVEYLDICFSIRARNMFRARFLNEVDGQAFNLIEDSNNLHLAHSRAIWQVAVRMYERLRYTKET
ncbi:MAG: hypothetical protein PVG04_07725, partial [Anaerolineales bacterium]